MPRVDVLIPAYNAAETLSAAIASIQCQTLADILIHVVDDGSTDATAAILTDLTAADPRIRVHRQPNGGIVAALNHGLTFCRGSFVARHDADDLAYPERLAIQVAYLEDHPDVVAVGASARHIGPDDQPLGSIAKPAPPDDADPFHLPSREPYIIHPLLTVRRSAIAAVGGYRHVHHSEDTDLYWRLIERGRLVNLRQVLGDYRLHDASISGGSIVNGRIMAVGSQLAALSARRRRAGRPDLAFRRADLARYKEAGSLASMVAIAGERLDEEERVYLADASAAKLLELTTYRPYDLAASDCDFIGGRARQGYPNLSPGLRGVQRRHVSGAAARLAARGHWREALRLVPPRLLPGFAARVLLRTGIPPFLRPLFRRRASRTALEK